MAPGGQFLLFSELSQSPGWDILAFTAGGVPDIKPFLQTSFKETNSRFSPDGRWMAYESDEPGNPEVYVQPSPGPGRKVRVSSDGSSQPLWARDGLQLFYWFEEFKAKVPAKWSELTVVSR